VPGIKGVVEHERHRATAEQHAGAGGHLVEHLAQRAPTGDRALDVEQHLEQALALAQRAHAQQTLVRVALALGTPPPLGL
jgi:hypothetical protein